MLFTNISTPTPVTDAVASTTRGSQMPDEKIDRLFLRSNCFDCGKVRGEIDFSAVQDDEFRGTFGEEL